MRDIINKNLNTLSILIILIFFSPLFFYSFEYVINIWAFSDAFVNYSHGFIRRGLLGTILIKLNHLTGINVFYLHSLIFLIFTIINIFLFIYLIKKVSNDKIVYLFLLFNPALILFPLYDTGGYLRKEILVLTLMFLHVIMCSKFHTGKLSLKKYNSFLFYLIPLIVALTLNHGIQFFLIPFHFFLTLNVYFKNFKLTTIREIFNFKYLIINLYLLCLIPLLLFFLYPVNIEQLTNIYNNVTIYNSNILWDPIKFLANPLSSAVVTETKNMFGSFNALRTYFIAIIFSVLPIIFIFNNYIKNNFLKIKNHKFLILSIFPIILLFFIGRDWGRWVNLLNFTILLYYLQFDLNKSAKIILFKNIQSKLLNLFKFGILILMIYYILFMMVPHCCNNTNPHMGGFIENFKMALSIIFGDFNIHLDNTFRKN